MPAAATFSGAKPVISWPLSRTCPKGGLSTPDIVRRVVLLPAPLAPIRATISPVSTFRETPWRAGTRP